MSTSTIQQAVHRTIEKVLRDSGRAVPEMTDESTFGESLKLDSLDLAVMVVTLESELGIDPFRHGASPVRTIGELVNVYAAALKPSE